MGEGGSAQALVVGQEAKTLGARIHTASEGGALGSLLKEDRSCPPSSKVLL